MRECGGIGRHSGLKIRRPQGLEGSSPSVPTKYIKLRRKMSWNHTQAEYEEFIRIWQTSETSGEALNGLLRSRDFPSRVKVSWLTSYGGKPYVTQLSNPYIQGVAQGLRKRGVNLKRLLKKPPQWNDMLDFQKLVILALQTEFDHIRRL